MAASESFAAGFGVALVAACVIFFRRIKHIILSIFGGTLDKTEFAGLIFTAAFLWMLYKEGTRTSEWHLFSELYIFVVAGAALTGLGLNRVLDHIKDLRSGTTSKEEITIKKETKEGEQN